MTRKLATIQRIKQLLPIEGADKIELAIINGWQVVTQKGQHQEGDLVVFYEIDSFLPASDPRYSSFEDRFINWGEKRGMRLKTIKLRKQLSQGLIMPVRSFPELTNTLQAGRNSSGDTVVNVRFSAEVEEGEDVTDILKIEKWEAVEPNGNAQATGSKTRQFPYFIRKTDQERIQNYGNLVSLTLDQRYEVTVKKDGSSMSVFVVTPDSQYYKDSIQLTQGRETFLQRVKRRIFSYFTKPAPVFGICSRNVLLPLDGGSNFHRAAAKVMGALESYTDFGGKSLAIQGEVVAPDIQGNYEKVKEVEFHLFDIFDIDKQRYFLPSERQQWVKEFGVRHVKVVDKGTLREILRYKDGDDLVKSLLTYASGPGDNPGVDREGVVFKHEDRDFSFKAVSNEYLLKTGK